MPRNFASFREDPPAIVQPARDLFSWAREQAEAIASTRARLDEKRADLATVEAIVEESGEFSDVEEAREAVKKAKADALDCDAVLRAKIALKKARKALKKVAAVGKMKAIQADVKALRGVVEEGKDRLATAIASGKVPSAVEDGAV